MLHSLWGLNVDGLDDYRSVHSNVCPPQSGSKVAVTRKRVAMRTNDSRLTSSEYSASPHTFIFPKVPRQLSRTIGVGVVLV